MTMTSEGYATVAGPVLDALVAERVMGWDVYPLEGGHLWIVRSDGEEELAGRGWSPSTNIAHAWEVVELLINNGVRVLLRSRHNPDIWEIVVTTSDLHLVEYGDTAPHAICLAALKAVE